MMTTPTIERLRNETLALMAEHAVIPARGWNQQRQRHQLHRQIDELIDRWALERLLIAEAIPRAVD